MKRISKMAEAAWIVGTVLCALGVVLCTKADFGLSMFAAPPYILHVKLKAYLPWYTQGTSEYVWQSAMLVLMCILVRRFRLKYLLSFLVAVAFGGIIDGWLWLLGGNAPYLTLPARIAALCAGQLIITFSVALVFRSYLPAQIPERFVLEVADRYHLPVTRVKLFTDIGCLLASCLLSLLLTGKLTGVGIGTVVITLSNAPLIALWGKLLDRLFLFDPLFPKLKK